MKTKFDNSTAIILAGGFGSRMGKDKKFLELPQGNLIDLVISNIKNIFGEIIISVSKDSDYRRKDFKIVKDIKKGKGPIMGIYSGLKESSSKINFIIAVDIPEIDYNLIKMMFRYTHNNDIVVPVTSTGKYEPLYSFFSKSTISEIEKNLDLGINKIIMLYTECKTKFVKMSDKKRIRNLNTPADYNEYIIEKRKID